MSSSKHTQGRLATDGLLLSIEGQNIGTSKVGQVYVKNFGNNNDGSKKEDTERLANAARIVECWNNYDQLVSIAKQTLFLFSNEANYPEGTQGYRIAAECRKVIESTKQP